LCGTDGNEGGVARFFSKYQSEGGTSFGLSTLGKGRGLLNVGFGALGYGVNELTKKKNNEKVTQVNFTWNSSEGGFWKIDFHESEEVHEYSTALLGKKNRSENISSFTCSARLSEGKLLFWGVGPRGMPLQVILVNAESSDGVQGKLLH